MIDEEATFEKFGYHSYDISPKSDKKIVVRCDDCGKVRIIKKRCYSPFCLSCSRKGERSPHWKGGKVKCVCKVCGKTFKVNQCVVKKGKGNFCSHECYFISLGKGKRIKKECEWCGKSFFVVPSAPKYGNPRFCCKVCQNKYQSANVRGENHPSWKGGKTERVCKNCGSIFLIFHSQIKQGYGVFCSKKCQSKWQSAHANGENSPAWQGGLSFFPYCSKFNEDFKSYIRDKFDNKCFICGKTEADNGKKLAVHHVDYDKTCLCNTGNSCQFVPLCASCHSKTNGNRDYWQEYIMAKLRSRLDGYYI